MKRIIFCSVAMIFLADGATAQDNFRTWTSKNGNHTIQAALVSIDGDNVNLKRSDGKTMSVAISDLSDADQKFIRSQGETAKSSGAKISKSLRKRLSQLDLKIVGGELSLIDESKLNRGLSESRKIRKKLTGQQQLIRMVTGQENARRQQIKQLTALNVNLNTQLANVTDVASNNRLVGAINANQSQITLIADQINELQDNLKSARSKRSQQTETYLQHILDLRTMADEITSKRTELDSNAEFQKLLSDAEQETGQKLLLAETKTFSRSLKKLAELEDTVLSDSIPLDRHGNTFSVSVNLNGEHTTTMVVDSGASIVCLPQEYARKFGVEPDSDDPRIVLTLADGRNIDGQVVIVESIRVGKFTVNDVPCAVLGPAAVNAEPLLGMSFLENFKFELNAAESTLTMVKIAEE